MSDSTPPSGPRPRHEYTEVVLELRITGTSTLGIDTATSIEAEVRRCLLEFDAPEVDVHRFVITPRRAHRDGDLEPALRASLKGGA